MTKQTTIVVAGALKVKVKATRQFGQSIALKFCTATANFLTQGCVYVGCVCMGGGGGGVVGVP